MKLNKETQNDFSAAFQSSLHEKRLLAIYDLSVQPYSIGDVIVFLEGSLVMSELLGIDKIDMCFICDTDRPPTDPIFNKVLGNNKHFYNLFLILPLIQLNPRLSSIFVFDSYSRMQQFISDNSEQYHIWPTIEQLERKEYTYYQIFHTLHNYYLQNHSIPQLIVGDALRSWADKFYQERVFPDLPVTVNLRNNSYFHEHRNADIDIWIKFFQYCENRYPVKFVIICAFSEIDERLRKPPNVIIAKDYNTNVIQDLALIQSAAFHMGTSSGIMSLIAFTKQPYFITKCFLTESNLLSHIHRYRGALIKISEDFLSFSFASSLQRLTARAETKELLISEFERIWTSVDWNAMKTKEHNHEKSDAKQSPLSWLQ